VNTVELWLVLLRGAQPPKLQQVVALYESKPQTPTCPTVILYGQQGSNRLYTDFKLRPALDAWDTGRVTSYDIVRWAKHVLNGETYGADKPHEAARS
jgi:hypothetical protein